ncbi:MAG: MarC family protein [Chloroflexota bacterium]|nr:MarC family protein [Chloroflexota bacterium]
MAAFLDWARDFPLVMVPLFVAMDPLGILPFVVSLLEPIREERRSAVIHIALVTGLVLGLLFLLLGRYLFQLLGIRLSDFLVAGGAILFVLALRELLSERLPEPVAADELVAVVPIGTPLLVGPATISLLILYTSLYGVWLVVLAFLANIVIAWIVFSQAQRIAGFLGKGGLRALSKVANLLLAAIAVQLISRGVLDIVHRASG